MIILVNITTLFVVGSLIGYLIELIFRRVVHKKWVNPGFLVGPYLPVYGFANLMLYGINSIPFNALPLWATILIKILVNFIFLTLLELVAGLIFIKCFHLKLWDYSDRWLNYKGIICPLFSLIWGCIGSIYTFFIYPYFMKGLSFLNNNLIYTFFIGIIIGMIFVDAAYSFHLGFKIKKASGDLIIKFEQMKESFKEKQIEFENKKKHSLGYVISKYSKEELKKELVKFADKITSIKKKLNNKKDTKKLK